MPKRSREDFLSPPESPYSAIDDSAPSSPTSIDTPLPSSKYTQIDKEHVIIGVMKCSLPPHSETISFSTFEDFENHYAKVHANRCSECRKNFPTEHFLGLHIAENHDPLNEARRAREEKTYKCFVEDCEKICLNPQKRRLHLIDKHMFPKNYDFLVVDDGIDKRSSMLRTRHRRRSSALTRAHEREQYSRNVSASTNGFGHDAGARHSGTVDTEIGENGEVSYMTKVRPAVESSSLSKDMESLTDTMSALKFVPPSVRFGRGRRRGGLSRT